MSVYTKVPSGPGDLDLISDRIRALYVRNRSAQLGRPFKLQSRFVQNEELWLHAAKVCLQYKLSPADLVQALFMFNQVPGGPFPNQLGGKSIIGHAARFKSQHKDVSVWWKEQHINAMNAIHTFGMMDPPVSPVTVLTEFPYRVNINPVIACCALPTTKVFKCHAWTALQHLEADPALCEILEKINLSLAWVPRARDFLQQLNERHE